MDQQIIEPSRKSHRIIFTVITILLTAGIVGGSVWYAMDRDNSEKVSGEMTKEDALEQAKNYTPTGVCTSVITPAIHTKTGAEYEFPSGCLLEGWERKGQNKTEIKKDEVKTEKTNTVAENKVYTDEIGKYTIKVPNNYIAMVSSDCEGMCHSEVTIGSKISEAAYGRTFFSISTSQNNPALSLEGWLNELKKDNKISSEAKVESVTVGGVQAKKYSAPGMDGMGSNYFFIKNSLRYQISDTPTTTNFGDNIVKSFKIN